MEDGVGEGSDAASVLHATGEAAFEVLPLRVIHKKTSTGFEDNPEMSLKPGDIIAGRYEAGYPTYVAIPTICHMTYLSSFEQCARACVQLLATPISLMRLWRTDFSRSHIIFSVSLNKMLR